MVDSTYVKLYAERGGGVADAIDEMARPRPVAREWHGDSSEASS